MRQDRNHDLYDGEMTISKKQKLPDIPIEVNVEIGDNWEEMGIYK